MKYTSTKDKIYYLFYRYKYSKDIYSIITLNAV